MDIGSLTSILILLATPMKKKQGESITVRNRDGLALRVSHVRAGVGYQLRLDAAHARISGRLLPIESRPRV